MPLIKVHLSSLEIPARKPLLVEKLREVMVEALKINEEVGQVVLYEAVPSHRAVHESRSKSFVFIEVLLYSGRNPETKEALLKGLVKEASKQLQIAEKDINCCLVEIPKENWYSGIIQA